MTAVTFTTSEPRKYFKSCDYDIYHKRRYLKSPNSIERRMKLTITKITINLKTILLLLMNNMPCLIDTTDNTRAIYSECCSNLMLLTVTNHCNARLRNLSNADLNIKER
jgi:hypothetical protein